MLSAQNGIPRAQGTTSPRVPPVAFWPAPRIATSRATMPLSPPRRPNGPTLVSPRLPVAPPTASAKLAFAASAPTLHVTNRASLGATIGHPSVRPPDVGLCQSASSGAIPTRSIAESVRPMTPGHPIPAAQIVRMPTGVLRVVPAGTTNHNPVGMTSPLRPTRHSLGGSPVRVATAAAAAEPVRRPQVIRRVTARPAPDITVRRAERTATEGSSATLAVGIKSPRDLEDTAFGLGGLPPAVEEPPHPAAGPNLTLFAYEQKQQEDPHLGAVSDLSHTSGLKQVPVRDALLTLKRHATSAKLSRSEFLQGYEEVLLAASVALPSEEVRNSVFNLFDRDGNDAVDMMELICGMSILCGGSEEERIQAIFAVFDENGDKYISMDEMFKFLSSVFQVVLTPQAKGVLNSIGIKVDSAEDIASFTALECFKQADLNHDGKLSLEEFKAWFYAPRHNTSLLALRPM
mmetsp:Transcript_33248/g.60949  ORF Transcript_33248/g.60949 Transcript_33248/m.60949 type:complete len:460 (-) Transcript_33248:2-1381(-)